MNIEAKNNEPLTLLSGEKYVVSFKYKRGLTLPDNQTKVSWSNAGILKYPINIMVPMMEKHVAKDMDISLSTLKNILEK